MMKEKNSYDNGICDIDAIVLLVEFSSTYGSPYCLRVSVDSSSSDMEQMLISHCRWRFAQVLLILHTIGATGRW